MIVVDVNVLVAAFVRSHPNHSRAARLLATAFEDLSPVVIPDVVWSGFARLATGAIHPSILATWTDVRQFAHDLQSDPRYAVGVRGLNGGIDTFLGLCDQTGAMRNLVSDAYIAAIALENDCPVASFDRDFVRFEGLAVVSE
ncbi:MAG: hypothetical protein LBK95_08515 [Bifidobacteriaceae bacterium]|jgi:toxin-antitoxin system PIN domain toxin|nr:hypothetical protein [Bifidobacteriaceae bacterium]